MKRKAKTLGKLPCIRTDSQAEQFVADGDLTKFDLSALKSVQFESAPRAARVNMRLPGGTPERGQAGGKTARRAVSALHSPDSRAAVKES